MSEGMERETRLELATSSLEELSFHEHVIPCIA
jgi:hypothetical protein